MTQAQWDDAQAASARARRRNPASYTAGCPVDGHSGCLDFGHALQRPAAHGPANPSPLFRSQSTHGDAPGDQNFLRAVFSFARTGEAGVFLDVEPARS